MRTMRNVTVAMLMGGVLLGSMRQPACAQGVDPGGFDQGEGSGGSGLGEPGLSRAPVGATPHDEPDTPQGGPADPDKKDAPLPPPPSLPGSHAQPIPSAPTDKAAGDMDPNTALFDAINRGDTVAAHDALNRGADINARNVLGLTPIDLSVDLGRNDISFLLLSLRSADQAAATPAATRADIAAPATGTRTVTRASVGASVGARAGRAQTLATPGARSGVQATAGGAPVPAAGFLGFGSAP